MKYHGVILLVAALTMCHTTISVASSGFDKCTKQGKPTKCLDRKCPQWDCNNRCKVGGIYTNETKCSDIKDKNHCNKRYVKTEDSKGSQNKYHMYQKCVWNKSTKKCKTGDSCKDYLNADKYSAVGKGVTDCNNLCEKVYLSTSGKKDCKQCCEVDYRKNNASDCSTYTKWWYMKTSGTD